MKKMQKPKYGRLFFILVVILSLAGGISSAVPARLGAHIFALPAVLAGPAAPSLGSAQAFGVLAGSTATNTGPTIVTGDVGVSPGAAVTGFPPGTVIGGTIHSADATAALAQVALTTAYNDLAGRTCGTDLTGQDLGGLTLTTGVYCFDTSAQLTGALVLDAEGDSTAVFIFQIGSTLTTASNASVSMINLGNECNVYWQVGSSATLGTGAAFAGNILALTSITLNSGASVSGRVLARNGAVTMDTNSIAGVCLAAPPATATATSTASATATRAATATPFFAGVAVYPPAPWHDPICAGDRQRYTLSYVNLTDETLTNVWIVDTLDGACPEGCDVCQWSNNGWPFDDCSPGAIYDSQRTVRWFFSSVAPGQRIDLYLEVRLWTNVPAGAFTNCLTVSSDQLPDVTACSQVTVLICVTPGLQPSVTPTVPLPTRRPGEVCYDSVPGEQMIYRITREDFYGYTTDNASDSALVGVTSPPAPAGWTLPGFVPGSAWKRGRQVWWDEWIVPRWETFPDAMIVGLEDEGGHGEGVDGITHLIRHTFQLDPPGPNMRIASAILEQWSDNKTAWWWEGELMVDELEGNGREDQMYPLYIAPEGGTYSLAIQNSNDMQYVENPQGTAYRLCVIWVPVEDVTVTPPTPTATTTTQRLLLPLITMSNGELN